MTPLYRSTMGRVVTELILLKTSHEEADVIMINQLLWVVTTSSTTKSVKVICGGGPTPITPETDQILPVGHGQEWSRMVKNVFSLKEASFKIV